MASNKKTGWVFRNILLASLALVLVLIGAATPAGVILSTARYTQDSVALLQPPPPEQGGTCISGFIIDRDGQPTGTGWIVKITSPDGKTTSGQAGTDGRFLFEQLAGGVWQIALEIPEGWQPFTPALFPVTLGGAGNVCANVRFQVEAQPAAGIGCIDGYQTNQLGQGLSAWTITAASLDSSEVFTTTTDLQGYFKFPGLVSGKWTVKQAQQAGWLAVSPAEVEVLVEGSASCQQVGFSSQAQFACVDVYKKDSSDGSGLAGWEISIKPADNGLTIADITDGTGWVRFSDLAPGAYTITERPQAGWQATTPITMTVQLAATGACELVILQNQPGTAVAQPEPVEEPQTLQVEQPKTREKPPAKPGCRAMYRVKAGDTLFRIAKRHEISVHRLLRYNPIPNPNLIYPRQLICIP